MRPFLPALIVFALSLLTSSCVMVGETPVTGRMLAIPRAELREVMATYRASPQRVHSKIYRIEVISRDEVHLQYTDFGSYDTMMRVRGKWKPSGGAIVLD